MKIFIDTASIKEIKEAASLGLLDGVTTNPSLVAKEGKDFRAMLDEILAIVDGPVSAEVISTDYEGILKEGRELAAIHKNIVVKVPLIKEGLKAVRTLSEEGIKKARMLPARSVLVTCIGATIGKTGLIRSRKDRRRYLVFPIMFRMTNITAIYQSLNFFL